MTNVLSVCFRAEEINMCVRARASTRCLTVVDYISSFLCSFSTWFHAMNWCRRCSSSGRPPSLLQTTRPWGVSPGKRTRICSCIISVCASFSYSHWRAQVYCIKGQALSSLKSQRGRPLSTLFEQRSLGSLCCWPPPWLMRVRKPRDTDWGCTSSTYVINTLRRGNSVLTGFQTAPPTQIDDNRVERLKS